MAQACRNVIRNLWLEYSLPNGTNASLIRDRYLLFDVRDKEKDKDKTRGVEAKKGLYEAMFNALKSAATLYDPAFQQYVTSLGSSKTGGDFETLGRLVIGLGSENVLETGITLHHTYGTPVIPGSALKGLASHYCDQIWGAKKSDFKNGGKYHNLLFGTTDDSGHILFQDAWITSDSLTQSLKRDIMTPHHGDYYSGNDSAPTDFDEPNPISFLSISGVFHIAVACDVQDSNGKEWEKLAFRILSEALANWGIGGKTSTGYGRMKRLEGKSPVQKNTPQQGVTLAGRPDPRSQSQGGRSPGDASQSRSSFHGRENRR